MSKIIFLVLLVNLSSAVAATSLKSHEHGLVSLEMAVEADQIEVSLDGPMESFLGFEHAIKSKADQKAWDLAKNNWTNNFFEIFKFDPKIKCEQISSDFKSEDEKAGHADLIASKKIKCNANLKGQKVSIRIKKFFKHMDKIKLELISDKPQSILIKENNKEIEL